jgi:hypothetical protein
LLAASFSFVGIPKRYLPPRSLETASVGWKSAGMAGRMFEPILLHFVECEMYDLCFNKAVHGRAMASGRRHGIPESLDVLGGRTGDAKVSKWSKWGGDVNGVLPVSLLWA